MSNAKLLGDYVLLVDSFLPHLAGQEDAVLRGKANEARRMGRRIMQEIVSALQDEEDKRDLLFLADANILTVTIAGDRDQPRSSLRNLPRSSESA